MAILNYPVMNGAWTGKDWIDFGQAVLYYGLVDGSTPSRCAGAIDAMTIEPYEERKYGSGGGPPVTEDYYIVSKEGLKINIASYNFNPGFLHNAAWGSTAASISPGGHRTLLFYGNTGRRYASYSAQEDRRSQKIQIAARIIHENPNGPVWDFRIWKCIPINLSPLNFNKESWNIISFSLQAFPHQTTWTGASTIIDPITTDNVHSGELMWADCVY